jgi:UDP-MurNAc hydroxylase
MKITFLGHAGLYIETKTASVLCDPWFNSAFMGSWYPFPANDGIEPNTIGNPDFLYISHQHQDHLDRKFLTDHVSKKTRVLLPEFPLGHFRTLLEDCGFRNFETIKNNEPTRIDGLDVMIAAVTSPSDGPIGDSGLALGDGETLVFNQNDCHPQDLKALQSLGTFDGHFLQFSGAIWYPFVYNLPPEQLASLGKAKRLNQQNRALRFIKDLDARHVFPCAGPPCFLDDELFRLNDFDNDPSNIFCDQPVFLDFMRRANRDNGRLVIPGSVIRLSGQSRTCDVAHPVPQTDIDSIFQDKRAYLTRYQSRMRPAIDSFRNSLPQGELDIVGALKSWFEPVLQKAEIIRREVNALVLMDCSPDAKFVIDFPQGRVYSWTNETCAYRFAVEPALLKKCILERCEDWVNELFLSCRFSAERDLPYNEHLYSFFKSLSMERIEYIESYYANVDNGKKGTFLRDGYRIQRLCPHRGADLERFGKISGGILTCQMHGWQFELATGKCITSSGHRLSVEPAGENPKDPPRHALVKDESTEFDPIPKRNQVP